MEKLQAVLACGCCGGCPCCPGWPQGQSGIINWLTVVEATNDCESAPSPIEVSSDFGCSGSLSDTGTLLRTAATELWVRVYCDTDTQAWHVQYRSAATGATFESPTSTTWANAPDVVFSCPDCANAIDGIAYGTIDFTAVMACEISGPTIVEYNILVHGEVQIGCP